MKAYETTSKDLLIQLKHLWPNDFSRINPDGTPIQFALNISPKALYLQYLSEPGSPESSVTDRIKLSQSKMKTVADLFHVHPKETSAALNLLTQAAPENDPELLSDPAGAISIGSSFSPTAKPKLTIYINGAWGNESKQWKRVESFVTNFGTNKLWNKTHEQLISGMKPLGLAISLCENSPLSGRVYLRAYGNSLSYFDQLVRQTSNKTYHSHFERFIETFLHENKQYPLKSTVCSYGFGNKTTSDFKFELCAHCAIENDIIAKEKCVTWLNSMNLNPTPYLQLLQAITKKQLSAKSIDFHSYIGLGLKEKEVYSTIYFNPNWTKMMKKP